MMKCLAKGVIGSCYVSFWKCAAGTVFWNNIPDEDSGFSCREDMLFTFTRIYSREERKYEYQLTIGRYQLSVIRMR